MIVNKTTTYHTAAGESDIHIGQ